MGVGRQANYKYWSGDEVARLQTLYTDASKVELSSCFNRSWEAIKVKAIKMHLIRYKTRDPTPQLVLSSSDIGKLVGLIEGEGGLTVSRKWAMPRLYITNTNKDLINFFLAKLGGHVSCHDNGDRCRPIYVAEIADIRHLTKVLTLLQPQMISKRRQRQVELALCICSLKLKSHNKSNSTLSLSEKQELF